MGAGAQGPAERLRREGEVSAPDLVPLLAILLLLAVPAVTAAQGGLPIGGDHGAYAGLDEALAAVDRPGALLFHRELGWHARFALFDEIRSGEVELRYFPSTVYLADSATKAPHKETVCHRARLGAAAGFRDAAGGAAAEGRGCAAQRAFYGV